VTPKAGGVQGAARHIQWNVAASRDSLVPCNMPEPKPSLKCPICGTPSDFNTPPIGAFCSVRCKLVDLGKWLGEEYRISEPLRPDHFADDEDEGQGR
jgi:uncharacterized protein